MFVDCVNCSTFNAFYLCLLKPLWILNVYWISECYACIENIEINRNKKEILNRFQLWILVINQACWLPDYWVKVREALFLTFKAMECYVSALGVGGEPRSPLLLIPVLSSSHLLHWRERGDEIDLFQLLHLSSPRHNTREGCSSFTQW